MAKASSHAYRKGDFILLVMTLFWGTSYYFSDVCLEELGPFALTAYRFVAAFIVLFIILFPKLRKPSKVVIRYSFITGILLFGAYAFSNFSLLHTNLSNASFLSSIPVIIVPVFAWAFQKRRPGIQFTIIALICFIGIAMLTLSDKFVPRIGDIFGVLCSACSAVYILLVERAVQEDDADALQLGVYSQAFVAVFSLAAALIFDRPDSGGLLVLPESGHIWLMIAYLTVFCTAVAFIMQTLGQKYTTAARTSVIVSIEPVFSGIFAYILAGDILTPRRYAGAALMILSVFMLEVNFSGIYRRLTCGHRPTRGANDDRGR